MPFWSDVDTQPKLSFKWLASFGTVRTAGHVGSNTINTYSLRTFQKPSFEIATSEYIWLNDVGYRPGVLSWNPIEITITDVENDNENNTRKLYNILVESGYQNADVNKPQSVIEKQKASIALGGQISLMQIDSEGRVIETWTLINPFIISVNFGQNNYAAEEILTISLNLRYDYAGYESQRR